MLINKCLAFVLSRKRTKVFQKIVQLAFQKLPIGFSLHKEQSLFPPPSP